MRHLAFSTIFLATSLVVIAPGCSKSGKDADAEQAKGAADAKPADAAKSAATANPADAGAEAIARPEAGGGPAVAAAAHDAGQGPFAAALALVPEQVEFMVGLSPKAIHASPFYAMVAKELAEDPQFRDALASFKECGIDPSKLDAVVIGFNQSEEFMVVVGGEAIGEDAKATCVIGTIQKQAGEGATATVVTEDGRKQIEFSDGRAYLVNDQTLALTSTAWQPAVTELINGKGTPAFTGNKRELFAKVDTGASVWGVAAVPSEFAAMAGMLGLPPELSGLQGLTGSVDLSTGVGVSVLGTFDGPQKATAVATQLQSQLAAIAPAVPAELAGVVKTIKIEAREADLALTMSATVAELMAAKNVAPQ